MYTVTAEKFDQFCKNHVNYLSHSGNICGKEINYSDFNLHGWYLKGYDMQEINFSNCKFTDCVFINVNFDECIFTRTSFNNCNFIGCSLRITKFIKSAFHKCIFKSGDNISDLSKAVIKNTMFDNVSIDDAKLDQCKITDCIGKCIITNSSVIDSYFKCNSIDITAGNIEYDHDEYSNNINWIEEYENSNNTHRIIMSIILKIKKKLRIE